MNNNRNNNRRRGRGNRSNQNGASNQNRIDSRARGNAPQLLDKYKKLAQDAQHNGDRVQMEYYLQFADHYFRVIADNKARQDESRGKRVDDRDQANDDGDDYDDGDKARRNGRRERPRRDDNDLFYAEGEAGVEGEMFDQDYGVDDAPEPRSESRAEPRPEQRAEPRRRTRQARPETRSDTRSDTRPETRADTRSEAGEARPARARAEAGDAKPIRARKPRRAKVNGADHAGDDDAVGIDSSVLPPAIRADNPSDGDDTLEAVG